MTKITEQDINYDKNSLYFGYSARISILIVLFAILIIICGLLGHKLINYNEESNINYIEVAKTSCDAVLKENDFYQNDVIKESDNLKYLSSLTNALEINFDYKLNFDKEIEGNYTTKVIGELSIYNPSTKANYYIETFDLNAEETHQFQDTKILYNENVTINYSEYNSKVQEFKNKYSKDSKAKFTVYLIINADIAPLDYKNTKKIESKIPLSFSVGKKEILIYKPYVDNVGKLEFKKQNISIYSIILEILIIILIITIIIVFLKLNKLLSKLQPKETEYDKELKRILEEYNSIIVNVSILPEKDKYKKVVIDNFDELLDLKNSINEPIRYIEISPHNKSYFFIKHNDELFIYTLKNTSKER